MKTRPPLPLVAVFSVATAVLPAAWAESLVDIETVSVGDIGNAVDTRVMTDGSSGYGAVSYPFAIGKYEVTIGQYTTFLNAAAKFSDTVGGESLWDPRMETDTWAGGIARTGMGSAAEPFAYAVIGDGRRPITYVDWFDAARFCNWLHNGATAASDTETGAYALDGATNGFYVKGIGATWWIPTEDEWYKAAYYDSGRGSSGGYWAYPNRKDSMVPGEGNFYETGYAVGGPGDNKLAVVGSYLGVVSYYGTYDQAGNVWEWNDTLTSPSRRGIRGGGWPGTDLGDPDVRHARFRDNGRVPTDSGSYLGFRVAKALPLPSASPAPTVAPEGIASVRLLPANRKVHAGKSAKLFVMVSNSTTQTKSVEVRFTSSNPAVPAPASVTVTAQGKKSEKGKKPRATRQRIQVAIPAAASGSAVITASVGSGVSTATSTLNIRVPKRQ